MVAPSGALLRPENAFAFELGQDVAGDLLAVLRSEEASRLRSVFASALPAGAADRLTRGDHPELRGVSGNPPTAFPG